MEHPIPDPVKGAALNAFDRYEQRRRDPEAVPRAPKSVGRIAPDTGTVVYMNVATIICAMDLTDGRVCVNLAPYKGDFFRVNQPARGHLPRLFTQFKEPGEVIDATHAAWRTGQQFRDTNPDSDDDADVANDPTAVVVTPDANLKLYQILPGKDQPVFMPTSGSVDAVVRALPPAGVYDIAADAMMKRAITKPSRERLYRAGLGGNTDDTYCPLEDMGEPGYPIEEHKYKIPKDMTVDEFSPPGERGTAPTGWVDEVKDPIEKETARTNAGSDAVWVASNVDAAASDNTSEDDPDDPEPDNGVDDEDVEGVGPYATHVDVEAAARKGGNGKRKVKRTKEGKVIARSTGRGKEGFNSPKPVPIDDREAVFNERPAGYAWTATLDSRAFLPFESPLVPYLVILYSTGRIKLWPMVWGFPDRPFAVPLAPNNKIKSGLMFSAARQVEVMYMTGIPTAVGAVGEIDVKRSGVRKQLTVRVRRKIGEPKGKTRLQAHQFVDLEDVVFALREAPLLREGAAGYVQRASTNTLQPTGWGDRVLKSADVRALLRIPWARGGSNPIDCAQRFHAALTGGLWEVCHWPINNAMMQLHMLGANLNTVREQLRTDDGPPSLERDIPGTEKHVAAIAASLWGLIRALRASPMVGILRPPTDIAFQEEQLALDHFRWTARGGVEDFKAIADVFAARANMKNAIVFSEAMGGCRGALPRVAFSMVRAGGASSVVSPVQEGDTLPGPAGQEIPLEIPARAFSLSEEENIATGATDKPSSNLAVSSDAPDREGVAVVPNNRYAVLMKAIADAVFMFSAVYTQPYTSRTAAETVVADTTKPLPDDAVSSMSTTEIVLGCLVTSIGRVARGEFDTTPPPVRGPVAPTHLVVLTVDSDHHDLIVAQLQRRMAVSGRAEEGNVTRGATYATAVSSGMVSVVDTSRFTGRIALAGIGCIAGNMKAPLPPDMAGLVSSTTLQMTTTSRVVICVADAHLWTPGKMHAALRFGIELWKSASKAAKHALAKQRFAADTGMLEVPKLGTRGVTAEQAAATTVRVTDDQMRGFRAFVARIRVRAPELVITGRPDIASPRDDEDWGPGTMLARSLLRTTCLVHPEYKSFSNMPDVEGASVRIQALEHAVAMAQDDAFRTMLPGATPAPDQMFVPAHKLGPPVPAPAPGAEASDRLGDSDSDGEDADVAAITRASNPVTTVASITPQAVLGVSGSCSKYVDSTTRMMASGMASIQRQHAEEAIDSGTCPPVQMWSAFSDEGLVRLPTKAQVSDACVKLSSYQDFEASFSPPMLFGKHMREVYVAMGTMSAALAARSLAMARKRDLPVHDNALVPIYVGLGDPVQNVTGDGGLYCVSEMTNVDGQACALVPTGEKVLSDRYRVGLTSARAQVPAPTDGVEKLVFDAHRSKAITTTGGATEVVMGPRFIAQRLVMTPERAASLVGRHGTHVVVVFLSNEEVKHGGRLTFHRLATVFRAMPVGCVMIIVTDALFTVENIFKDATPEPSATVLDVMMFHAAMRVSRRKHAARSAAMAARERAAQARATAAVTEAATNKRIAEEHAADTAPPGAKRVRA